MSTEMLENNVRCHVLYARPCQSRDMYYLTESLQPAEEGAFPVL